MPVLRKDFVIDMRQIAETKALGADAVLLIAGVLGDRLPAFVDAVYGAGLEPLVEVRNAREIECALLTRAQLDRDQQPGPLHHDHRPVHDP